MGAYFIGKYDRKGWKPGKRDPFSCRYVDKVTDGVDCKDHCFKLAHDKFNSCEGVYPKFSLFDRSLTGGFRLVYTLEESAEQFIFEEIVDITTWEY
ncbi:hypothetical protein ARMGADRAFT_1014625, partial [Armillaria gallica]